MDVELTAATEDHKDVLANLLQFYRYDFSEFRGYELTPGFMLPPGCGCDR